MMPERPACLRVVLLLGLLLLIKQLAPVAGQSGAGRCLPVGSTGCTPSACCETHGDSKQPVCCARPASGPPVCLLAAEASSEGYHGCLEPATENPRVTGFDGGEFEIDSRHSGTYLNIISEQNHQVNAYFTGRDAVHSRMVSVGLMYKRHKVQVTLEDDGTLKVELEGESVRMAEGDNVLNLDVEDDDMVPGELTLSWEFYKPYFGHTVEFRTPVVVTLVWSVPPHATQESKQADQPAFLNLQTKLVQPPGSKMSGILGQTYHKVNFINSAGTAHLPAVGGLQQYEVSDIFGRDFDSNMFVSQQSGRELVELDVDYIGFPLVAKLHAPEGQ